MNRRTFSHFVLYLTIFSIPTILWARPRYAVKHRINRCTACHVSPAGGGLRNTNGKMYGTQNFQPSKYSMQDVFMADIRGIYFFPEKESEAKGGLGVMAGNFSLNVPVIEGKENQGEIRLAYTHNIGGFPGGAGSVRPAFLRWRGAPDPETSWLPQYVIAGRFVAPFGWLTDEHRTYTKIQSSTMWNRDLEGGVIVSANPFESLHYDLAAVNGESLAAASIPQGNAPLWGAVANLRWMPERWPFALGASHIYHERAEGESDPNATAYYALLSFDRSVGSWLRGSLLVEYVQASQLNSNVTGFVGDTGYFTALQGENSEGWWAELTIDLSQQLALIYKYDSLILDRDFPADAYTRHGIGAKYYFGPNAFTHVRFEDAEAGHPNEKGSTTTGALNAAWVYLQVSI